MYYEEQQINGVWYWRSTPTGDWIPFTTRQLAQKRILREHNERKEAIRKADEEAMDAFLKHQEEARAKALAEYQDAILNGAFVVYHAAVSAIGALYEPDHPVWDGFYSTREKAVKALNEYFDKSGIPTILDDNVWTAQSFGTAYEGRIFEELVR